MAVGRVGEEDDSGMGSLEQSSKDVTPEKPKAPEIGGVSPSEEGSPEKPKEQNQKNEGDSKLEKNEEDQVGKSSDPPKAQSTPNTNEVVPVNKSKQITEDDDEDFEDETLAERLYGLTEMFPEILVRKTESLIRGTKTAISELYRHSRTVTWVLFSSSVVLFAPIIFEVERAQMEEAQRSQQKQVLLGPSAVSNPLGPGVPMPPR